MEDDLKVAVSAVAKLIGKRDPWRDKYGIQLITALQQRSSSSAVRLDREQLDSLIRATLRGR